MSGFKPVELFGGAITADFPTAFGDVRYVLDNLRFSSVLLELSGLLSEK